LVAPEPAEPTVADVGEFALIDRLHARFRQAGVGVVKGIGDDTAALQVQPGNLLLATTDAAVEDVHFRRQTTTPFVLGQRVLAVNLSDIASMGGEPRWALLSLGLPPTTPLAWVEALADGLGTEAARYGMAIVGGNLTRSPDRLVIDVTLLGEVASDQVLYRTGARPGDRVLVTGTLGDSAAGLALLAGLTPGPSEEAAFLIERHRLPTPRVAAGRAIAASGLATAMLDLSDGLAGDLAHLAEASGVGAVIDADRVPLSPAVRALAAATGQDPLAWALRGGEDYELLLTAPPSATDRLVAVVQATGVPLTDVGEIRSARGLWLREPDGRSVPLGDVAWRHFA
jgi:thiamine-monophosphate kinase